MKTVLVVDGNKVTLASARQVLQDQYKVVPVTKGQEALTYLETGECDILLLDIHLPDMDGFEVLERVRGIERCRNLPAIFLTADNDAATETRCFQKGAADFIGKPFVPDVMLSRIARALELEDLRHNLANRLEQTNREIYDMRNKSYQDALTGLWNRIYTEETINSLLDRKTPGALMMIDIDNFKLINDNYGHIAGDRTLTMFADLLRKMSAPEDVLCRIGGDEFVIFVRGDAPKEELGNHAKLIISEFAVRINDFGFKLNTSISVGIALAPHDGAKFIDLYGCADKALYFVKQNGKSGYHFFSDRLQAESSRNGKTVDLKYLQDLMSRADSGRGAYQLDFESFHHVYNFIRRFVERSNRDVQTVLFTVSENGNMDLEAAEAEYTLELLEEAIYTSLRRSDVSTRYSSKQLIVILMDANSESGDMVAERIIENFHKLYTRGKVTIDYGIARLDSHLPTVRR